MVAQMLSRRGQWLSRLAAKPSFAGAGLLERMRSTTFALLGVTAAMGLGLVAIVSQQGWPVLPASPLPVAPTEHAEVHDAIAVRSPFPSSVSRLSPGKRAGKPAADRGAGPAEARASRLSGSRQLAAPPPPSSSGPVADGPSGDGASPPPESAAPPPSQAPAAAPTPAPAPQPASAPAAPVTASSPSAPQPPAVDAPVKQGKGNAYGKYKPGGGKGGKKPGYPEPEAPPSSPPPPVVASGESEEHEIEPSGEDAGDDSGAYPGRGHGHGYGHYRN